MGWLEFRRAYAKVTSSVAVEAAKWSTLDPSLNIIGATHALDWGGFKTALLIGWGESATIAVRASVKQALRDEGSALTLTEKDAHVQSDEFVGLSTADLADQLTLDWMQSRGLALADRLTKKARGAAENILYDAVQRNLALSTTVAKLKTVIGLSDRDANALGRYRDELIKQGANGTTIIQRTAAYRKQLINHRSEAIAITEMGAARNMGKLNAWRVMQHAGELGKTAGKQWDPEPGACSSCVAMATGGPVTINQPFVGQGAQVSSPPLHTRCGCGIKLVRELPA